MVQFKNLDIITELVAVSGATVNRKISPWDSLKISWMPPGKYEAANMPGYFVEHSCWHGMILGVRKDGERFTMSFWVPDESFKSAIENEKLREFYRYSFCPCAAGRQCEYHKGLL